ncbi:uncharacterized protein LOC143878724 [Tasmannia lanceolata]|uniref:uncharacterized protein LOC143878724 n=1 Tax=Tasmannia lanceolata TaxID=3420 RepID=UPI00406340F4
MGSNGNHSLSVVLQRVEDASKVVFTGVYGPSLRVEKRRFWEELNVVRDRWVFPWCIGGDFNEIRFVGERSGCRRTTRNMVAFDDFIANHELVDLPLSGARFTWNRGESQSRIDRFLICPGWSNLVPDVYQRSLIHSVSDHCPILLDPRLQSWGRPPFRFEIAWLQAPRMEERLGEWWSFIKSKGPSDVVIGRKLRFVKKKLREWVKEKRAFDQNRLRWLESRIGEINFLEGEGNGNSNLREELGRIKAEHNGILLHEEISWRQKSRVKWLKEGIRTRHIFMPWLVLGGGKLYSSDGSLRPTPEELVFKRLDEDQCRVLEKPFEEEEIEKGVFSLGRDKAPGPDGFCLAFFKHVGHM